MIVSISVEHSGTLYICFFDEEVFKCGKCLRGNVIPKIGDTCRVCDAIVRVIDDKDAAPMHRAVIESAYKEIQLLLKRIPQ